MSFEPIKRDLLFTSSIYDSYKWFMSAPPSWKDKAFHDFEAALSRKPWQPSPAIQRGITFENMVYATAQLTNPPETSELFTECVNAVRGATFQKKIKKVVTINGQSFCLYGKTDASFPKKIVDVKTTGNFKRSKYLGSIQHELYMYIEDVLDFEYVVAVFNDTDDTDKEIKSVQHVNINFDEEGHTALQFIIAEKVTEFYTFITNDAELRKAYLEKFCLF